MEKRKLEIDNSLKNDKNKNGYTFIIPNSNIGEVNIAYQKKDKKKTSSKK